MTCRVDHYGPEWAHRMIEDLDDGTPGHEAVAKATEGLRNQAQEAENRAILADQHAEQWIASKMICADTFARARTGSLGSAMRLEAEDLRRQADGAATLKGEVHRLRDPADDPRCHPWLNWRCACKLTHETDAFSQRACWSAPQC